MEKIWRIRNKPIYDDAESPIIKRNLIKEIGKNINKVKYVDGQFMGLIVIPKLLRKNFNILDEKYEKYQTTKFLNNLIKLGFKIKPIKCNEHWYEFDDWDDYKNYLKILKNFMNFVSVFFKSFNDFLKIKKIDQSDKQILFTQKILVIGII